MAHRRPAIHRLASMPSTNTLLYWRGVELLNRTTPFLPLFFPTL